MTLIGLLAWIQTPSNYGWGHPGVWGWFWLPLALVPWIALGALIWYLVVRAGRPQPRLVGERAREILAERFARGEITSEEYDDRLGHL